MEIADLHGAPAPAASSFGLSDIDTRSGRAPSAANSPSSTLPDSTLADSTLPDSTLADLTVPDGLASLPELAELPEYGPPPPDTDGPRPKKKRRGLRAILPAPIWHIGRLLIVALILEYLVLPQLAGPRKVGHLLTEVNPLLLLAGLALEACALLCYSLLTRAVLPDPHRIKFFSLFRIQLTTLSVSHCAPGGSAAGTALGYRLLTRFGVKGGDAGFALAMQGIGSAVVLNVILWLALVVSIPAWGFSPVYLLAAIVGSALLIAAVALLYAFTKGEDRVADLLERAASRVPFVDSVALRRSFVRLAARVTELGRQGKDLRRAVLWASLNWILDAASLYVMVGAFGHWVNPDGLIVAYGLANVLAVIPLTPGGLGVIEATLTTLLVGFGTPRGVATLGVIVYRFINFWLPIPVGGLAYLTLRVDQTAERRGWDWDWGHLRPSRLWKALY